jgi:peptide/nickel transport system permease protein
MTAQAINKVEKKRVNRTVQRFLRNRLAVFGLIILLILSFAAIFAPLLATHSLEELDLKNTNSPPSPIHILGTDEVGRDTYSRLLYAGRVSLSVGIVSTMISAAIGVILGALAGYFGGVVDGVIMRIVDIFMCFPFFVIAISLAAILGPSIYNVMLISGVLGWTSICRIVRAEVLSLKTREFVEAARALGVSNWKNITGHVIPNTFSLIIVYATLGIASGILSEAGLSFLGLGVKQPQPSWGNMLASAQSFVALQNRWWQWVPAGLLVFITILAINFVGDGLRDALDPKLSR